MVKVDDGFDLIKHFENINQETQLQKENNNAEVFKWIDLNKLSENDVSLAIDKLVVKLLNESN